MHLNLKKQGKMANVLQDMDTMEDMKEEKCPNCKSRNCVCYFIKTEPEAIIYEFLCKDCYSAFSIV